MESDPHIKDAFRDRVGRREDFQMFRSILLCGAASAALLAAVPAFAQEKTETITVTAEKLAAARNGIQTQTEASPYTITARDIQAPPGGDNAHFTPLTLQLPSAPQD